MAKAGTVGKNLTAAKKELKVLNLKSKQFVFTFCAL
jgi:hypothetical protein